MFINVQGTVGYHYPISYRSFLMTVKDLEALVGIGTVTDAMESFNVRLEQEEDVLTIHGYSENTTFIDGCFIKEWNLEIDWPRIGVYSLPITEEGYKNIVKKHLKQL